MTVPDWIERASPDGLGKFLRTEASPRKGGLFVRHLLRCFPGLITDPRSLAALDAADRYEAGNIDGFGEALQAAADVAAEARPVSAVASGGAELAYLAAVGYDPSFLPLLRRTVLYAAGSNLNPRKNPIAPVMRPVFVEHFGDPRRPVTPDPDWLTPTVVDLATGVYADRAFYRLPVLADALDDAGCTDPAVLGHLRGPGPHARGCWVVDLLLGKT